MFMVKKRRVCNVPVLFFCFFFLFLWCVFLCFILLFLFFRVKVSVWSLLESAQMHKRKNISKFYIRLEETTYSTSLIMTSLMEQSVTSRTWYVVCIQTPFLNKISFKILIFFLNSKGVLGLLISFRVFRAKRQCFKPSRFRLGLHANKYFE